MFLSLIFIWIITSLLRVAKSDSQEQDSPEISQKSNLFIVQHMNTEIYGTKEGTVTSDPLQNQFIKLEEIEFFYDTISPKLIGFQTKISQNSIRITYPLLGRISAFFHIFQHSSDISVVEISSDIHQCKALRFFMIDGSNSKWFGIPDFDQVSRIPIEDDLIGLTWREDSSGTGCGLILQQVLCEENSNCPAIRPKCSNGICQRECSMDSACSEQANLKFCFNGQCQECSPIHPCKPGYTCELIKSNFVCLRRNEADEDLEPQRLLSCSSLSYVQTSYIGASGGTPSCNGNPSSLAELQYGYTWLNPSFPPYQLAGVSCNIQLIGSYSYHSTLGSETGPTQQYTASGFVTMVQAEYYSGYLTALRFIQNNGVVSQWYGYHVPGATLASLTINGEITGQCAYTSGGVVSVGYLIQKMSCSGSCPCSSYPNFPICSGSGYCVQCMTNAECSGGKVCSASNFCVQCVTNAECSGSVCHIGNICVQCITNSECSGSTPYCSISNTCVACLANSECPLSTPFCTSSYTCSGCTSNSECAPTLFCKSPNCVQCKTNTECSGGTPWCSTSSTCVQCISNTECSGGTPYCSTSNTCVQCISNIECSSSTPICNSGNTCVGCTNNGECTPLVCNSPDCVQCKSNAECSGGTSQCDTSTHSCVQCLSNLECSGSTPICSASKSCVGCTSNTECTSPSFCSAPYCVQCKTNSECSGGTPECFTGSNICVQCLSNTECSGGTPFCHTGSHTCVQCLSNTECSGATPICSGSNSCVGCTSNVECTSPLVCSTPYCVHCKTNAECSGGTPECYISSHTCVQCLTNAECSGTTPICSGSNNCIPCVSNVECTSPFVCSAPYCVQCKTNAECSGGTPECHVSAHTCVQCLTNIECSGTTPICSGSNSCVGCTSNGECTYPLVCSAPYCVQCKTNVECSGGTPECRTSFHTCVQCLTNAECSGATPICSGSNSCVGCTSNVECTSPLVCSAPYCVQCKTNTECSGGTPECDVSSHTCVQCLTNAECTGATPICSGSHVCVPCSSNGECTYPRVCSAPFCVQCKTNAECSGGTPECHVSSHTCVQCLTNAECSGATPICTGSNSCVPCMSNIECTSPLVCFSPYCVQCKTNAECFDPTPSCSIPNHICVTPPTLTLTEIGSNHSVVTVSIVSNQVMMDSVLLPDQIFSINIEGIDPSQYSISFQNQSSTITYLCIRFNGEIDNSNPTLNLIIISPNNYEDLFYVSPVPLSYSLSLNVLPYISDGEYAMIENMKSVIGVGSATTVAAAGTVMLTHPSLSVTVFQFLQIFNYISLVNINLPYNVLRILELASSSTFNFLPLNAYFQIQDHIKTPQKFEDQGIDAFIFANFGPTFMLMGFAIIFLIFAYAFVKYFRCSLWIIRPICIKYVVSMKWSGLFALVISNFFNVAIYALLQTRYPAFDSGIHSFATFFGIFISLACLAFPIIVYKIHKLNRKKKKNLKKKYAIIMAGYKTKKFAQQQFICLTLLQSLIYAFALCFFQDSPGVQLFLLIATNFSVLIAVLLVKPFLRLKRTILNIGVNLITLIIFLIMIPLLINENRKIMGYNTYMNIGWAIIALFIASLLVIIAISLFDQYKSLKKFIRNYRRHMRKQRERNKKTNAAVSHPQERYFIRSRVVD